MSFPPSRRSPRGRSSLASPVLGALLAVAVTFAVACGGDHTVTAPPPPAPAAPASVARVVAGAAMDTVFIGDSHTLVVQTLDAGGVPLAGRTVAWASATPLVASVTDAGVVTGLVPGQTTVTATSEGQTAVMVIVVLTQPVARVAFADSALARDIGETATSPLTVRDRHGVELIGRPVAYASDQPAVATVDATTGAITALSPGTAVITATSEGQAGTLRFTVRPPPPVARVAFASDAVAIDEGQTTLAPATAFDSLGRPLTDRAILYASSAPAVADVEADGRILAHAPGSASITATSEGRTAAVVVTVRRLSVARIVVVVPGTQRPVVGDSVAFSVLAYAANGQPLSGRAATFASSAPAIAAVAPTSGMVRAVGAGSTLITATVESISQNVRFDVLPMPPTAIALTPTALTVEVGQTATIAITGTDRNGKPTPVTTAAFTSSNPAVATVAATTGLVGGRSAGTTTITATVGALRATATVTVTAPFVPPTGGPGGGPGGGPTSGPSTTPTTPATGFSIDVRFTNSASADLQDLARRAAARWGEIITGALTPQRVDLGAEWCDAGAPAVHETVQNLVVFVRLDDIDGAGRVLAFAGPCVLRSSFNGGLPSVGSITLDSVDLRRMIEQGRTRTVQDIVTHEMGHILGLGTLWSDLVVSRSSTPLPDYFYTGAGAMQASTALGFTGTGGEVPVENDGGPGTMGAHWRESVFRSELMTGYINAVNPLSTVTVGALRDLGYTVSAARADPLSPSTALRAPGARLDDAGFAIEERLLGPRISPDQRRR